MRKKVKYIAGLITVFLLMAFQPAWAGGPPAPSIFSNPLALILIILMILLLIVIGILAAILVGAADVKLKKTKSKTTAVTAIVLFIFLLLPGSSTFAQTETTEVATTAAKTIGGLSASTFYLMATVIFLELGLIIAMLINIRMLLKIEKVNIAAEIKPEKAKELKRSWWEKLNKFRPVNQEQDLDLGHEYDGIRELNNGLPPWWLYGFYITIIVAVVYMWRFHVSHTGPSSKQEYEASVAKAELKIQNYLKAKGESVDENTVTMLTAANDIADGKAVFMKSCAACHQETGAGNVGPNLTDDFWLHGNDIKSIFKTIRYGINAMPQWQNTYSNKEIAQVASYIKTLHGTNPANPKAPQGIEMKEESIPVAADSTKSKMAVSQ